VHVEDATIERARGRGSSGGHLWGRREIEWVVGATSES
jgi:hypothetical protein